MDPFKNLIRYVQQYIYMIRMNNRVKANDALAAVQVAHTVFDNAVNDLLDELHIQFKSVFGSK